MLKERPKCRKAIEANDLRPQIHQGRWDGYRAVRPDGTIVGLTSSMAKQMRKMLSEGRWPGDRRKVYQVAERCSGVSVVRECP